MEKYDAKVISKEPCKLTVSFEVGAGEIAKTLESIFGTIQKEAAVPGFRQGKAPLDIIKKEFAATAEQKALNRLSAEAVYGYMEKTKMRAAAVPSVTHMSYEPGGTFKFTAALECHPEISAKNYRKIKVSRKKTDVSETDVAERLKSLAERNASLAADLAGVIAPNSFVVIDYEMEADGKKIPGASAENYLVDAANPANIKGLNEALPGLKPGESKTIEVTFGPDYPAAGLRGKTGLLKFVIKEIKKKVVPAIDDGLAKDMGYKNLAELKEAVSSAVKAERQKESRDDLRRQIDAALLKSNDFEVPQTTAAEYAKSILETMKNYFSANGLPESEWTKRKEDFEKRAAEDARDAVRLFYLYDKIAETEKLSVSAEDAAKARDTLKNVYGSDEAGFEKRWRDNETQIRLDILREKVFNFLLDEASVKEV